jgi:hypothetical protein
MCASSSLLLVLDPSTHSKGCAVTVMHVAERNWRRREVGFSRTKFGGGMAGCEDAMQADVFLYPWTIMFRWGHIRVHVHNV